jgi:NADH pyrophosphatase NudC (nudix superfamily)
VPHVLCPSCGLASYAVTPHSAPSLCPHCDAELFPVLRPAAGEDEAELEAEAAA